MMKMKLIPGLAVLVMLLFTAGCPVDVNGGAGDDGDDGPAAECPTSDLATVRFFHAAGGTPVTRPQFGPSTTRNLNVVRPDLQDPVPGSDSTVPRAVTTIVAGRATTVQLCGNKSLMLGARLAGASADRVTTTITLTPDADPSLFKVGTTIVLAGISDSLIPDPSNPSMMIPENPASVANPLIFIVVPDTFSTGSETQLQVVHASRKTPTPIDVEANPDSAGPDITALDRYTFSSVISTKGSAELAPATVPVTFLDAGAAKASFTISPRLPTAAKALAIHFDTEIFDPANSDPTKRNPAPVARLFVTGDDPLLGRVPTGGVTF